MLNFFEKMMMGLAFIAMVCLIILLITITYKAVPAIVNGTLYWPTGDNVKCKVFNE